MEQYEESTYVESEGITHYQQQQPHVDDQHQAHLEEEEQLGVSHTQIVDEAELLAAQAAAEEAAAQQQQQQVDAFNNVAQGLTGKYRDMMMQYWQETINSIEHDEHDFKNHQLPLARIKKVMKTDEDVRMISAEAPILFAKGCDVFITELTMRAWIHAEENKRRTLQKSDIAAALTKSDMFDFLIDIVPREEEKPKRAYGQSRSTSFVNQQGTSGATTGTSSSLGQTAPPPLQPPSLPGQQHQQDQLPQDQSEVGSHPEHHMHEHLPDGGIKPDEAKDDQQQLLHQQLLHEQMLQQQLLDQQPQHSQPGEIHNQRLPQPPPPPAHEQEQHQPPQPGSNSMGNSISHSDTRTEGGNGYSNYNGYQGNF